MREAIIDNDLRLLQVVNRRLELVSRLRAYKAEHDMPFVDEARERWMHRYLAGANPGPVTEAGLMALYDEVLALTKRESAEAGAPVSSRCGSPPA